MIQEIHTILPYMQFCAATPMQEAMCTVLVDAEKPYEGSDSYYDWLREQYAGKRHRLERALAAAGIRSLKGEGGFFLIGDVSKIKVVSSRGGVAMAWSAVPQDRFACFHRIVRSDAIDLPVPTAEATAAT